MSYWQILGIKPTTDLRSIKRAYSALLKRTKPDQDPEGYQRLREAFDAASRYSKQNIDLAEQESKNHISSEQTDTSSGDASTDSPPSYDNFQSQAITLDSSQALEHIAPESEPEPDEFEKSCLEIRNDFDAVLQIPDDDRAINAFRKLNRTDQLLDLELKKYFERMCFDIGLNWNYERTFPHELFKAITNEFEWGHRRTGDWLIDNHLPNLLAQIQAAESYEYLVERSNNSSLLKRDVAAAKIILGEYRPFLFHIQHFFEYRDQDVRNIIDLFTHKYSLDHCPQLNTETFRWWYRHKEADDYKFKHLILGFVLAIPALLLVSFLIESYSNPPLQSSIGYSGSLHLVLAGLLSIAGWKAAKPVSNFIDRINFHYQQFVYSRWYQLITLIILLILIILSVYVPDGLPRLLALTVTSVYTIRIYRNDALPLAIFFGVYVFARFTMDFGEISEKIDLRILTILLPALGYLSWKFLRSRLPHPIMDKLDRKRELDFSAMVLTSIILSYLGLIIIRALFSLLDI